MSMSQRSIAAYATMRPYDSTPFLSHARSRNKVLKQWIETMRDLGFDEEYIRCVIWNGSGVHLSRLGRHQDNRLISGAE